MISAVYIGSKNKAKGRRSVGEEIINKFWKNFCYYFMDYPLDTFTSIKLTEFLNNTFNWTYSNKLMILYLR